MLRVLVGPGIRIEPRARQKFDKTGILNLKKEKRPEGEEGGDTLIALAPHPRHAPYAGQMAQRVDRTGIEPWPIIHTSVGRANSLHGSTTADELTS